MIELGLQRISRLLANTALPWRAIHVAGTNGKGSICAYVSNMLDVYNRSEWRSANGHTALKHARFTSPHLIDRWDCITINQEPVSRAVFHKVEQHVLERNERDNIEASEFELLTATAFEIFTREKADIGVVEVGMGGRLDATNIIGQSDGIQTPDGIDEIVFRPSPLVTAISSIGLDHQGFLGNTLKEIAREKAGIIKPRVPVIHAPNSSTVTEIIAKTALRCRSPLYAAAPTPEEVPEPRTLQSLLDYLETYHSLSSLSEHSRSNARTAFLSTWVALQQLGRLPIDIAQVLKPSVGLPMPPTIDMFQAPWHTNFPGRLQKLSIAKLTGRKADVLLDGAHNAQSAQALRADIERSGWRSGGQKMTWVMAASDSKDAKEILAPLLHDGDVVFAVEFGPVDGMPWVKPRRSTELLESARAVVSNSASLTSRDCGGGIRSAIEAASESAAGGPLVIAGSLYLVGDVLRLLRDTP